ncbi:DUF2062 domain-containing protein [Maritimibacter sp. DP07]|jgi:uncharacterized protein (DUF2062 family)|uniref:DUF2062 domain-containing protein n=1 Tax=Maritimibacter harenae TaxID=2606218 RepID=A0A845M8R7_9RHOB|nr:DUF2062 domain-containing protein [Maritimibacter harenae]MZR15258.1 DUF2062 domain-containing protein [Maritimibacter harenae]
MFKRNPRSYLRILVEFFYPRGGWYRASRYVIHRVRRLPDPADRIARGIAAGVFVSFTPLFGLHFVTAALIAWIIRGNMLAAVLATFVGNPLTFPFIAGFSLQLGNKILGNVHGHLRLSEIVEAFSRASEDIWHNFLSIFTHRQADWAGLDLFLDRIFLPYLVGGLLPGLALAFIAFGLSRPLITAYQKRRVKMLRKSYEKRMAERAKRQKENET